MAEKDKLYTRIRVQGTKAKKSSGEKRERCRRRFGRVAMNVKSKLHVLSSVLTMIRIGQIDRRCSVRS